MAKPSALQETALFHTLYSSTETQETLEARHDGWIGREARRRCEDPPSSTDDEDAVAVWQDDNDPVVVSEARLREQLDQSERGGVRAAPRC